MTSLLNYSLNASNFQAFSNEVGSPEVIVNLSVNKPFDPCKDIRLPSIKELFHDLPKASSTILINSSTNAHSYYKPNTPISANSNSESSQNAVPAVRIRKSIHQLDLLEQVYLHTPFPNRLLRSQLAACLNLKPRIVQIWFQNKRQKAKREL